MIAETVITKVCALADEALHVYLRTYINLYLSGYILIGALHILSTMRVLNRVSFNSVLRVK